MGKVELSDVVIIVAQTMCKDTVDLQAVIDGYLERTGYLRGLDAVKCHEVAAELWASCRIHQPRCLASKYSYGVVIRDSAVWKDVVDIEQ
jgi:hypothetical protein